MNWEIVRTAFLELLLEKLEEQEESFETFTDELIQKLKEQGYEIDPATEVFLIQFTQRAISEVLKSLSDVVEIVADITEQDLGPVVEEVIRHRYPDGLNLSERLWNWDAETRRGVAEIISQGIRLKRSAQGIAYEIENYLRIHGKIDDEIKEKWLKRLEEVARASVRDLEARKKLQRLLKRLEKDLNKLKDELSIAERKSLIETIKKAIEEGKEELIERAIKVFLQKQSLRRLKTITQTEMAHTFHRVQIRATEKDPYLVGYRWKLSKAHPKPDICDVYANVNYGLGKGVWPKDKVPKAKPHPHCLCYLLPVYSRKKKTPQNSPKIDVEPLVKKHKYLKALKELGYDLTRIIDLDPETGYYLKEKDFLEKLGISKEEWKVIKKALTDRKLKKLGERLGIGSKSIFREGDLIKHPIREEYTKVVKVIKDLLGNERILTEVYQKKIEAPILPKKRVWQIPYRKWGAENLEKILQNPDVILQDKEGAYLYGKWYKKQLVVVAVGSDSFFIYTVYPLENANKILEGKLERYIIIYKR